jgi:hypothetical protein
MANEILSNRYKQLKVLEEASIVARPNYSNFVRLIIIEWTGTRVNIMEKEVTIVTNKGAKQVITSSRKLSFPLTRKSKAKYYNPD